MNPDVRRKFCWPLAVLMALLYQGETALAGQAVQAEIRFSAASGEAWVGQGIDLHLELWSDALSFSGQNWVLPQVPGAILIQNDSAALNMNERRGGASWQGVRYSFQLYPQRQGSLSVPPFAVRFATRNGYGTEPRAWSFETPRLSLESRLPPGARPNELLLTTESFELQAEWSVGQPGDDAVELDVGDAIRLTVERQANDVPGMVFAPLKVPDIEGLGIYPDEPQVVDRNFRGSLTGTRRDVITFVCEKAGDYRLPGQRFSWWNPDTGELNEAVIPALAMKVNPPPAGTGNDGESDSGARLSTVLAKITAWIVLLLVLAAAGWVLRRPMSSWFTVRRDAMCAGERWAFWQVRASCLKGQANKAYAAINVWLQRCCPGSTQLELASSAGQGRLAGLLPDLQTRVASGQAENWNGKDLYQALKAWRREHGHGQRLKEQGLSALNPGPVK